MKTVRWMAAVLLCGCGAAPRAGRIATGESTLLADNGVSLNGVSLNGVSLNGVSLNGVSLNGVSLNGVSLNGVSLNGVAAGGATVHGRDFAGADLTGTLADGSTAALHVDAIAPAADDPEVLEYTVRYRLGDGSSGPLCGLDAEGAPVTAIPLAGRWDGRGGVAGGGAHLDEAGVFTFACNGYALAKCVHFGYQPWRSTLAEHHQACTRLLRADYCGDGTPHTVNGTPVDLFDRIGVQQDTEPSWSLEAEWTAAGASCIAEPRFGKLSDLPVCARKLHRGQCGERVGSGTLLVNRHEVRR